MKKLGKKAGALALSAAMLLSLTANPVWADDKDSDDVVTLNMWHIWAAESKSSKKPFEDAVAEFNEENEDIQIVLDATENETYKTKMVATIAANEAPDIYFYWSGGYMKNIVEAGKVLALDDYLSDDVLAEIKPGTLDNMTFDDKIYGLGYSMAIGTFFVNTEMFEENDIKIPESWDELVDACQKFIDLGITPMAVGAKEPWCIDMYLDMLLIRQAGYDECISALSKEGTYVTDDMIEGAQKLVDLVEMGAFGDGALGISRDESEVPFYNGEVPMYLNGSWTIGNINRDDCAVKDKIDIIEFPALSDKSDVKDFTGGASECFVVNADTEYPEECVYALTQILPKFAEKLYLSGAGFPTWFAEKALSFNEKYKIIFISAYDEFDYARKAIQLGAKGFLLKPFQRAELHDVLGKILKELDSEKENTFVQKEGKLVQQVVEYLERNYSDSTLSLSNTAEKFHINSSYLSRIFKKEYGINFIEFLTWYRIQKAVIYVKNTQMKAYEIAEKVVFTDTKYFGKCFKKLEGVSIQEYRRKQ